MNGLAQSPWSSMGRARVTDLKSQWTALEASCVYRIIAIFLARTWLWTARAYCHVV
jgi:hypothetical protein